MSVCFYVCACLNVSHMHEKPTEKRTLDSPAWVLAIEPWSFTRTATAFNLWASSLVPKFRVLLCPLGLEELHVFLLSCVEEVVVSTLPGLWIQWPTRLWRLNPVPDMWQTLAVPWVLLVYWSDRASEKRQNLKAFSYGCLKIDNAEAAFFFHTVLCATCDLAPVAVVHLRPPCYRGLACACFTSVPGS